MKTEKEFITDDEYYQFVCEMKRQTPECDTDSWLYDTKSRFAFNRGFIMGRKAYEEHESFLRTHLIYEEKKRKKLVELLKGKGVVVDASGEDIKIYEY